jgi:hypothetical protein
MSVWVQGSPSVHAVPSAFAGFEQAPVVGSHAPAAWHRSLAMQTTATPGAQWPAPSHVSLPLHELPSEHDAPAATGVCAAPVGEQKSIVQGFPSSALTVDPLAHAPPWHESPTVHGLPSVQVVPLGTAGLEHAPLAGSHVPATWHGSAAEQTTGFVPVHVPAWHASLWVQAFPSSQVVPLA